MKERDRRYLKAVKLGVGITYLVVSRPVHERSSSVGNVLIIGYFRGL